MAKQLGEISLVIIGDEDGASTAKFRYRVSHTDDASLSKYGVLDVEAPVFSVDTIDDFFDGYVDAIKTIEGIV